MSTPFAGIILCRFQGYNLRLSIAALPPQRRVQMYNRAFQICNTFISAIKQKTCNTNFSNSFEAMTWTQILEIASAAFSILYSLLLMKEKTMGWWFGILSSVVGMVLFFFTKLYAQSAISLYYAGVGFYGLWYWKKAEQRNEHIHLWTYARHTFTILAFTTISIFVGSLLAFYTDNKSPYMDSFITIFGFLASIKEARKVLSSWIYWFVINGCSVVLYYQQGLYYYAVLMIVYTAICIKGYLSWYRIYVSNLSN